jgi:CRISPR-associated protein Csm4
MIKKYTLEALSPFSSPLWSDTVSGYFMWLVKYAFGEEKMIELIDDFKSGNPPFVLSDGLPAQYLPTPATLRKTLANYLYGEKGDENEKALMHKLNVNDIRKIEKKIKNTRWIKADLLKRWNNGADFLDVVCEIYRDTGNAFETVVQPHNAINRDSWSSSGDGGNYFEMESTIALCKYLDFYAWVRDDKTATILNQCFKALEYEGFGADRSTGKGRMRLAEPAPANATEMFDKKTDLMMSLSHFFPAQNDTQGIAWNVDVKYGRVGERGYGLDVSKGVFKLPVMLLMPGAVFESTDNKWIGRSIGNIALDKRVIQIAYGLMLPVTKKIYPV